ncbi:hypothetical protein PaecuDRAFT_2388 [Paenibacillus curdlanolyticus YK9]|uniref:Uncharacterized protein n=1 Tax=Paenibacillus curdlanolyticus YK9 TaxID=717606 RepID=E0I9Q1_9BACL|nr:hypothetical protein [Paenibacillus curdlanolyticus]EFM11135.1 hypothetical protein PaecuDRAFT_2388 [Paenibacillus curdlanolyticus YK9]
MMKKKSITKALIMALTAALLVAPAAAYADTAKASTAVTAAQSQTSYSIQYMPNRVTQGIGAVYFTPSFQCDYAILTYEYNGQQQNVFMSASSLYGPNGFVYYNVPQNSVIRVTYWQTGVGQSDTPWQTI